MLSRIAESLYWVGRYVERADDTARILDVHYHHLIEDPQANHAAAAATLLDVMDARQVVDLQPDADTQTTNEAMMQLALDQESSNSIVGALAAARDNARGAREAISSEVWECLNTTANMVVAMTAEPSGSWPTDFFKYVKERAAMFSGLIDSSMSRDDGWRFVSLGRSIERADMTARLLTARYAEAAGSPEWVTTLRSCSAHESYLRTYRRTVDGSLVVEFLLLDRLFPRSVFHALATAETCLEQLGATQSHNGYDNDARRIVGRVRTDLEYGQVADLLRDLPSHLQRINRVCSEVDDAVSQRYFRQVAPIEWNSGAA
jgi:uncharacterized alpha-E superfamily protein